MSGVVKKRTLRELCGPLVLAALIAAISAVAASASVGAVKPTLTIGLSTPPSSLDPAKVGDGETAVLPSLSYEPLVHQQKDGTFTPGLATSWHYVGTSSKNFVLTLRRNARFSDGSVVDANAVKTYWEYEKKACLVACPQMPPIRSIETRGRWTVQINLASPSPIMPYVFSEQGGWGNIASPKAIANSAILGTRTVGAGPYTLLPSQSVASDHYTFVPNKYYFDKSKIHWSKVVVKVITQSSSMLQAAQTGQIQVAWGSLDTASAASRAGLKLVARRGGAVRIAFMDLSGAITKALGDVRVRQAMSYALDRKAISQALFGKYGIPTSEDPTPDGWVPSLQNAYPYNPTKAKALLAAAGYPNGFSTNVVGQGFGGSQGTPMIQAMAKYFSAVGIKLDIYSAPDFSDYVQKFIAHTYALLNVGNYFSMWTFYNYYLGPKAIVNQHGFDDPVIDKLWLKGQRLHGAAAVKVWQQITKRMTDRVITLPVAIIPNFWYVGKGVQGVAADPTTSFLSMPPQWSPSK